jgi:hypothetical protein
VLVAELAREPRAAGSEHEATVRGACADWLRSLGFEVAEERFVYSALPGRWATPAGASGAAGLVMLAGHVGYRGHALAALLVLLGGGLAAVAFGAWVARRGVLSLPWMRREGRNLTASRGGQGEVSVWLMAHLDSKSQPVPIAVRAMSLVLLSLSVLASLLCAVWQVAGRSSGEWWPALAILAVVTALPAALCGVGNRSPGALDNATGVAAVLLAAAALPAGRRLGVCLTSAEELGLAGARAWVSSRASGLPHAVLNVDSLDDAGETTVMWSGREPSTLLSALRSASRTTGTRVRCRRLLPGILTDSVALADAGCPAVTVSRGSLDTLLRIHSELDRAELLKGEGVAQVARLLVATLDTIEAQDA